MQLHGKGSMTQRNLIAVTFDNNATKDGKAQYLDIQLDSRDEFGSGQTNLHAVTRREQLTDEQKAAGQKPRINNGAAYYTQQFEAIKEAAGDNHVTLDNGAQVYCFKGDVMPTKGGLLVNTKGELAASDFEAHDKIIDDQFASVRDAKAAKDAQAEQSGEAEQDVSLDKDEQTQAYEPQV